MKKPLNPVIALTIKNGPVASALVEMLPNGDLSYYTDPDAVPETRDEALRPLWEKLQSPDHALLFSYEEWCKALHEIARPCTIFHDLDIHLQGWHWQSDDHRQATKLLNEQNEIIGYWYSIQGQTGQHPGQLAAFSQSIRDLYSRVPDSLKPSICKPEALEGRLQEMEANIAARFALNAAAAAFQQTALGRRQ